MKILIEVEILPKDGWRVLNAAEVEINSGTYITDAPEDHLVTWDDDQYSSALWEPRYAGQDVGEWIRMGLRVDTSDPPVTIGTITQYGEIGNV